ncbi:hypothetical protein AMELA_G00280150 [Ameiurus melas]|uniref:Uncharacterized protein n=1 Tax=Ameiurus melas TaxID=219545 RepID=A0A7J5ZML5_AMEME|nr:hypothetical protein AMELA_G00280150 [Ameiurus melas]
MISHEDEIRDMTKTGKPDVYWYDILCKYAQGKYHSQQARSQEQRSGRLRCTVLITVHHTSRPVFTTCLGKESLANAVITSLLNRQG